MVFYVERIIPRRTKAVEALYDFTLLTFPPGKMLVASTSVFRDETYEKKNGCRRENDPVLMSRVTKKSQSQATGHPWSKTEQKTEMHSKRNAFGGQL